MFERIKSLIESTFKATQKGEEFILRENDFGKIYLDTSAIRRIIERTKISGVHEIKNVFVDKPSDEDPLNIRLSMTIDYDLSAVSVGENLRDEIKRELYQLCRINNATFDIRVTHITSEVPEKNRRRVR